MMKHKKSLSVIIFSVALGLCLLASVLEVIAVLTCLDPDYNYFREGNVLPELAAILSLAGVVAGSVGAFLLPAPSSDGNTPYGHAGGWIAGAGFLASAVMIYLTCTVKVGKIAAIFLLLAAVYEVLSELPVRKKRPELVLIFGILAIFSLILLQADYYFDQTVEMNAPVKVLIQVGLLCSMLYITSELRFLLGIPMPRVCVMLVFWCFAATALAGPAFTAAYFPAKVMTRPDYLAGAILCFALAVSVILRFFPVFFRISDNKTKNDSNILDETVKYGEEPDVPGADEPERGDAK